MTDAFATRWTPPAVADGIFASMFAVSSNDLKTDSNRDIESEREGPAMELRAVASSLAIAVGWTGLASCAYPTRGILHSNLREPIAIADTMPELQLLRRAPGPSGDGTVRLSTHGYLDAKSCSSNVLGWATGDGSVHAAYDALLKRIEAEIKPVSHGGNLFLAELQVDQSYAGWLGVYSETCTIIGGIVIEGP